MVNESKDTENINRLKQRLNLIDLPFLFAVRSLKI
jgi:hypothetical protein